MSAMDGSDVVGNGKGNGNSMVDNGFSEDNGKCLQFSPNKKDEGDALENFRYVENVVVARMPVDRLATHYNMQHKYRGKALIFNHEKFDVNNLKSRIGTQEDCRNLRQTLLGLDFDVHVYQDLKYNEIESHIRDTAKIDHSDFDCLLIAVLSHGDSGIIYAKDTQYKPEGLWTRFTADRCPTLAGKPKIFLLQACQGDQLDSGVVLTNRTETDGQMFTSYRIPTQADFLIVFSTVKGYFSWRNTSRGSWFVQALCEELNEKALEMDFLTILTCVSRRVAFDYESNVPDLPYMHQQKQIPCIMSMLTRMIQFSRKSGCEIHSNISQESYKSRISFSGMFTKGKVKRYPFN